MAIEYNLNAGCAHGLTAGDELAVYPDMACALSEAGSPSAVLLIDKITNFSAELIPPDDVLNEPNGNLALDVDSVVLKTRNAPKDVLKLALPLYKHAFFLHSVLHSPERPFQNIICTIPEEADLNIIKNDSSGGLSIQITDSRTVNAIGATTWFRDGTTISPEELPDVLETALRYYWELERTDSSSQLPIEQIQIEVYELHDIESSFIEGEFELGSLGRDLCQSGEVHLGAHNGVRRIHGIRIVNHGDVDIHPNVCYFNPHELSIGGEFFYRHCSLWLTATRALFFFQTQYTRLPQIHMLRPHYERAVGYSPLATAWEGIPQSCCQ